MKRTALLFALLFTFSSFLTSCRETGTEKTEEIEVQQGTEDHEMREGTEQVQDTLEGGSGDIDRGDDL